MKKLLDILLIMSIVCSAVYFWFTYPIAMFCYLAIVAIVMSWSSIIDFFKKLKNKC